MGNIEFFSLLNNNFVFYFLSLIISGVIAYLIYRQANKEIMDPFTIALLGAVFANAIPIFLYICNEIDPFDFLYFCFFESFFWLGLLSYRNKWNRVINIVDIKIFPKDSMLFFILFGAFLLISLYKISVLGIPLFMDTSRLAYYQGTGGLGILSRILPFIKVFCVLYLYKKIIEKRKICILFLLIIIIFDVLDGAKGAIIFYIICYFYIRPIKVGFQKILIAVILFISVAFINLLISFEGDYVAALVSVGVRCVANGDVFYNLFPYKTYETYFVDNPVSYMYSHIFAPFRLTEYPINIGYTIGKEIGGLDDNFGPNLRGAIFFLLLFGRLGGIVGGYFFGLWLSTLIKLINKYLNTKSLVSISFTLYFYLIICSGITGLLDFTGTLFDLCFNVFILISLLLLISLCTRKNITHE